MRNEPERAAALEDMTPTETDELMKLFVGGFMLSRLTKRERREFLAGCDTMARIMEASTKLTRPASAAVLEATVRRKAVARYRRAQSDLKALI